MPNPDEPSLGNSWFNKPVVPPQLSEPPPASAPMLAERGGDPRWALVLGGVSGGVGGAAMMFVAAEVARRLRLDVDIIGTIGRGARILGDDSYKLGLAVSVAVGCVVGMIFGALMRHTVRMIARLLASVMLAIVLWTLVHAFVFKSFAAASLGDFMSACLDPLCPGNNQPELRSP